MICHLSELNEFSPEWKSDGNEIVLGNQRIGWVQHIVVCDRSGRPRYDQPIITCRPGPVCIAVDRKGRLALLHHMRPVIAAPSHKHQFPIVDVSALGMESLEFPRGGSNPHESERDTAAREVEEEVGFSVIGVELLDYSNGDTAFFPYSSRTCLVQIDENQISDLQPDPLEDAQVEFVTLSQMLELIASGKVLCAQTKAAFAVYLAHLQHSGKLSIVEH